MLSQPPECCKQAAARSRTQQHAAELLLARLLLPACLLLPPQLLLLLLPLTDDVVHEADGHGGGVRDSGHARCNGHIHGTLQAKHRLRESRMNVKKGGTGRLQQQGRKSSMMRGTDEHAQQSICCCRTWCEEKYSTAWRDDGCCAVLVQTSLAAHPTYNCVQQYRPCDLAPL